MKPHSRDRANQKPPAPTAGTGAAKQRPRRYRGRDLRIDATPEQLAAVIGTGPPKAPHEWNYLKRKPGQSDNDVQPQRSPKSSAAEPG